MNFELPPGFVQTIRNSFGPDGPRWLESFPVLLEEATLRWNLTDIQPISDLSFNFVAFAKRMPSKEANADGEVVLKLGVPHRELRSEIAALRFYNGRGICRLFDADVEKGMLLLERLKPGHMLAIVTDDEQATRIAAGAMENLWKSGSDYLHFHATEASAMEFIRLKDWFSGFQRMRKQFHGGTGPLPKQLVETAESLSDDLLSENKDEVLLHGDFHHFNVLESNRGWLAIDPKGVIGPRGYEVGPFLINPFDRFLDQGDPKIRTEKRIAILAEMLDMERNRIRAWAICHSVLSAWWCIEGNDPGCMEYSLRCAEIFKQVRV